MEVDVPGIRMPGLPARRLGLVMAGWDERPSAADCDVHGIGAEKGVALGWPCTPASAAGRLVVVVTASEPPASTSAVCVECDTADSNVVIACRSLCDTCDAGDGSGAGNAVPINPGQD